MTMTLSRSQFDNICKDFIEKYRHAPSDSVFASNGFTGWSWREHPSEPSFGYMQRQTTLTTCPEANPPEILSLSMLEEPSLQCTDNEVAWSPPASVVCSHFVVHSATFQVPTFYFTVNDASGTPLSLSEVLQTSLFRPSTFYGTEVNAFSVSTPSSNFPLLSHGEHPTLGTPCWYLHPCETATAVAEILQDDGAKDTELFGGWIEAWFLVLASVVDLRC
ncbi:hypothetical protein BJ138DRAFT_1140358 [Hygrophoropsis aurantiaca]|uniref:Uncharacterized protein n=1 Tax=Hygrophoropsis aurantiaca TaxID=72124 RepID=A0ACB8ATR7_9AGAM|nr:hypothetical protein BJ138DRAFT_1140358 [Hygrophoropsis aurantiaca]